MTAVGGTGATGTGATGTGATGTGATGTGAGGTTGTGGDVASGGMLATGGDVGTGGVTADGSVDGIQYFGRWDHSVPGEATASWGAVYLTARFEGTSVGIRLSDPNNDFQYSIDGGEMALLQPGLEQEYTLATGLADGEHTLEFYRRSGGSFGRTTVRGLILDEGKQLLSPPERPARKIEILGDSISVGYGNEGTGGTSRETENGYSAYGPELARLFGAQWSVVAHSGQGMFRNLGEDKADVGMNDHMPDEFQMTFFPGPGENPAWDFTRYQPDVLIIALGTNDFAWPQWDMDPGPEYPPTEEEFVGAYLDFLTFARSVYPNTEIFAVGTFIATASNQFGPANVYVCQAVDTFADLHTHCVDPGAAGPEGAWLASGSDYIGDWTHPTVAGNGKIAGKLAEIIGPVMGW